MACYQTVIWLNIYYCVFLPKARPQPMFSHIFLVCNMWCPWCGESLTFNSFFTGMICFWASWCLCYNFVYHFGLTVYLSMLLLCLGDSNMHHFYPCVISVVISGLKVCISLTELLNKGYMYHCQQLKIIGNKSLSHNICRQLLLPSLQH